MCVTGCLCVPADGESLGEREEWKDDSEDIVGRDTPTDHEPLKRDEPQVCGVCVCMWEGGGGGYLSSLSEREADSFLHATMQPVDSVVSFQCCPEDVVDTSHDREATPTTQSRDQIGATPPDHVGMSEAQQRIVDSLQDAGNVRTHTSFLYTLLLYSILLSGLHITLPGPILTLCPSLLPTLHPSPPLLPLTPAQVVMFAVEPMPWCEHLVEVQLSPPHTITYPHPTSPSSLNLHYSFSSLLPLFLSSLFLTVPSPPPPR